MLNAEIYEFKNGEWAYRFKGRNGEILCRSEGYDSKTNAKRGLETFYDNIYALLEVDGLSSKDAKIINLGN